jgi:hypothetical protein
VAKNKLSREDLEEFRRRLEALNHEERVLEGLRIANEFWMKVKIRQLGLDETKNYRFLRETGNIVVDETKEEDGTKGN